MLNEPFSGLKLAQILFCTCKEGNCDSSVCSTSTPEFCMQLQSQGVRHMRTWTPMDTLEWLQRANVDDEI